ncbi:MAG: hypothetical protein ABH810_01525 [bacterium]
METKTSRSVCLVVLVSIVLGILLRIYFLFQPGYELDINTFIHWSGKISEGGFWSLYTSNYQSGLDYPPLIPYLGHYWLGLKFFWNLADQQIFKLLPTLAEIIFSIIAAIFVWKSKSQYRAYLLVLVIIQPALSLITTAWGQVDSVLALFLICAFILIEKNLYLSTLFLFLALLTKPQALFGILIFYIIVLFRKGVLNALRQLVFFLILTGLMYWLFASHSSNFLAVYLLSSNRYPLTSMNAFNFWWLIFGSSSFSISDTIGQILSYKTIGLSLFVAFLAPAVFYLYKKAKTLPEYFLAASYIYLIFFTFPTQIHERYLYPAIALLPFAAIKNKKIFWVYIVLSVTLFLNNYAVLQSVIPQLKEVASVLNLPVSSGFTKVISLVNVVVAIYMAFNFIYESFKKDSK